MQLNSLMNLKINKKMKPKTYSIVALALISLLAYRAANAQDTTAAKPSVGETRSLNGQAQRKARPTTMGYGISTSPQAYAYVNPQSYTTVSGFPSLESFQSTDTAYRRKMEKLREQMRELNRQMADLNKEENKKNGTVNRERMAITLKGMNMKFDSTFRHTFTRSFSNNYSFNNNAGDANIEKKVQSGDVKLKTKIYTKSYPADGNDKLQIDNRFGKITVNTWNKNEFKVEVQIKAYADNDDDAQKLMDQTTIEDSKVNNLVSFTTVINQGRSSNTFWGTLTTNGKTIVRKTVINYTVYMPAKSAVSITNKYGAIELPTLDGKVTINSSYSNLIAKSLSNSNLNISYGSLSLDWADNVNANVSYTPIKIGKLGTTGTFNLRYGEGIEIGDVGKNLKNLTVNSAYAPVKLGSITDTNADFDVTVRYMNFIYDTNTISVTSKSPDDNKSYYSSTKNYKGHIGKGNPSKVITINSNYADVKFD